MSLISKICDNYYSSYDYGKAHQMIVALLTEVFHSILQRLVQIKKRFVSNVKRTLAIFVTSDREFCRQREKPLVCWE